MTNHYPVWMHTGTERDVEIPWVLDHLRSYPAHRHPQRVLDAGAADSQYLHQLKAVSDTLIGIDQRKFTAPRGVEAYIGDLTQLPVDWSDTFDLVTCISVLDHVGLEAYGAQPMDPWTALTRVVEGFHRVLKVPQGTLLVTVPFGQSTVGSHPAGGQRVFNLIELSDLFEASRWSWQDLEVYRMIDEQYQPTSPQECEDAQYLGYRAEAVILLKLRPRIRVPQGAV